MGIERYTDRHYNFYCERGYYYVPDPERDRAEEERLFDIEEGRKQVQRHLAATHKPVDWDEIPF